MDAGLAGVLGALIGALAAVAGAAITVRGQARQAREEFARQRKAESYGRAAQHLFRAAARRSSIALSGGELVPYLAKEDLPAWFLDMADALEALTATLAFAGSSCRAELEQLLIEHRRVVRQVVANDPTPPKDAIAEVWEMATRLQILALRDLTAKTGE